MVDSWNDGAPVTPPTISLAVAFMFNQWFEPNCQLEFPVGGSQAMVDALCR